MTATDGAIGHVKAAFFDDRSWTLRYVAVDTGKWLSGREVLISPYAVRQALGSGKNIDVSLTRDQVKASPEIDTHQPVSRQHELAFTDYYAYPQYWEGAGMWGMGDYPLLPSYAPTPEEMAARAAAHQRDFQANEVHLRSSVKVAGYEIHATDGTIGHVQDFVFDDESWAIRYLLVDTRNWWPGGRKVLIATRWIESIDWSSSTVQVNLTREQVKASPEYHEAQPIARDYEKRLHDAYSRTGYWD
ncbi:MAG: PRC-barrel domain-containing protein [Ramlibacter sp.]